jgi:copper(I)-binding protein
MLSFNAYSEITITEAYVATVPIGYEDAPAFISIKNDDRYPVYLKKASSSIAHVTLLQRYKNNDGAMMLQSVNDIKIPANSTLQMLPGERQITLKNLKQDIRPETTIELLLEFSNGKKISIDAPTKEKKIK